MVLQGFAARSRVQPGHASSILRRFSKHIASGARLCGSLLELGRHCFSVSRGHSHVHGFVDRLLASHIPLPRLPPPSSGRFNYRCRPLLGASRGESQRPRRGWTHPPSGIAGALGTRVWQTSNHPAPELVPAPRLQRRVRPHPLRLTSRPNPGILSPDERVGCCPRLPRRRRRVSRPHQAL